MSTKYINNFHTSKYSERTGSLGAARYRRAKFIAEQYCLFEIKTYLIYRHLLNSDVTKRASSRRVFWWSVNERVAHEHALEAFYTIFSVQYRPNRGNRGIHVISNFWVKSKHSITNRTMHMHGFFLLGFFFSVTRILSNYKIIKWEKLIFILSFVYVLYWL